MFEYIAYVTKVYDGDTITVDIDLGFGIWMKNESIRLADINAPEIRGEEREAGLVSRDALRKLILNKEVIIKTQKDEKGKYGRYIGTVIIHKITDILNESGDPTDIYVDEINVNDWLVENNYAIYKKY
jgi:micrococcal nuclease